MTINYLSPYIHIFKLAIFICAGYLFVVQSQPATAAIVPFELIDLPENSSIGDFQVTADKQTLVYIIEESSPPRSKLYSMPVDGSQLPVLLVNTSNIGQFKITPNGESVIYTVEISYENIETFQLFQLPINGGDSIRLDPSLAAIQESFSVTGPLTSVHRRFLVSSDSQSVFFGVKVIDVDENTELDILYEANLDSNSVHPFFSGRGWLSLFSPVNQTVFYYSQEPQSGANRLMGFASMLNRIIIYGDEIYIEKLTDNGDGYVYTDSDLSLGYGSIDGASHTLLDSTFDIDSANISLNSTSNYAVYYDRDEVTLQRNLVGVNLYNGEVEHLNVDLSSIGSQTTRVSTYQLSPDGESVAYGITFNNEDFRSLTNFYIRSLNQQDQQDIIISNFNSVASFNLTSYRFSPDSKRIVLTTAVSTAGTPKTSISVYNTETQQMVEIFDGKQNYHSLRIQEIDPSGQYALIKAITSEIKHTMFRLQINGKGETAAVDFLPEPSESQPINIQFLDVSDQILYRMNLSGLLYRGVVHSSPEITSIAPTGVVYGQAYLYEGAVGAEGDPDRLIKVGVKNFPSWLTFRQFDDGTFAIQGTPGAADVQNGKLIESEFIVIASDEYGLEATQTVQLIVREKNEPPEITGNLNDVLMEKRFSGSTYKALTALDPEDDSIRYEYTKGPDWVRLTDFGNGTAEFEFPRDEAVLGTYNIGVAVIDSFGGGTEYSFTLRVTPLIKVESPLNSTAVAGQPYSYKVETNASDFPSGLSITSIVKPNWLNFEDNGDGTATYSGTPTADDIDNTSIAFSIYPIVETEAVPFTGGFVLAVTAAPKLSQTISFPHPAPDGMEIGDSVPFNAVASSGLPVSYDEDGHAICSIENDLLVAHQSGTCVFGAFQNGNDEYHPADPVMHSFEIRKRAQAITIDEDQRTLKVGTVTPIELTASSGLDVLVQAITPGTCSLTGNLLTTFAIGTCTLSATQAGNDTYASTSAEIDINVTDKEVQLISFELPDVQEFEIGDSAQLRASSDSLLQVSFRSDTPAVCTVDENDFVIALTAGTCTLTASQAGDDTYAPAADVTRSFEITEPAPPAETVTNIYLPLVTR